MSLKQIKVRLSINLVSDIAGISEISIIGNGQGLWSAVEPAHNVSTGEEVKGEKTAHQGTSSVQ